MQKDTLEQHATRKKELLERQLMRISALSGRPVTASGATSLVAHQRPDTAPRPDSGAFGYIKPQDKLDALTQAANSKV